MSVNRVILKGRIGQDPILENNKIKFSIATDEGYKDNTGSKVEKTAWHNIVAFGKLAEVIQKYFKKGQEIFIIGKLDYFKTDEGKIYTTIIVNEFDFVGSSNNSTNQSAPPVQHEQSAEEEDDGLPF